MPERARGVLIVAASLDEKGGLQRRTMHTARVLAQHRPVTILTWRARRFPSVEHAGPNLKILRLPSVATWARDQRLPVAWANTAASLLTGAIAALWISRRWDVALAAGLVPEGVLAALCGVPLRKRVVVQTWLPGPRGNVARLESSPFAPLFKRMLRSAIFAGETEEMVSELRAAGFAPDRVHRLGWGVDLDRFVPAGDRRPQAKECLGIPSDRRVLAYWGRFDLSQKRLDLLLQAWRMTSPRRWQLLLAGDGPDRAHIEKMAADLDPQPVIVGWQDDVRTIIWAADAFALPTNFEGNARTAMEGMACGLPGIVSAIAPYTKPRAPGLITVSNDARAWADALNDLVVSEERARIGQAAREWAEKHFDIKVFEAGLVQYILTTEAS